MGFCALLVYALCFIALSLFFPCPFSSQSNSLTASSKACLHTWDMMPLSVGPNGNTTTMTTDSMYTCQASVCIGVEVIRGTICGEDKQQTLSPAFLSRTLAKHPPPRAIMPRPHAFSPYTPCHTSPAQCPGRLACRWSSHTWMWREEGLLDKPTTKVRRREWRGMMPSGCSKYCVARPTLEVNQLAVTSVSLPLRYTCIHPHRLL